MITTNISCRLPLVRRLSQHSSHLAQRAWQHIPQHTAPPTRLLCHASPYDTMALQVAANLNMMFREHKTLLERYAAAKSAGFALVEVSLPYSEGHERLAEALVRNDLKQVLINTDPGNTGKGEMGFACIPGKEEAFKESLEKSIVYAKTLNVPMIHVMVGLEDKNYTREEHRNTLEKNLIYATTVFKQHGIVGVVEPKNHITFPGYFLSDYDEAVDILNKINSPHLRLMLDIFHLQLICGRVTHNIERLIPYTAHVQVSQPPSRCEPCAPGELDFVYVIEKLKAAGYKGYIGAEYIPSKKTEDTLNWIKTCGLTF